MPANPNSGSQKDRKFIQLPLNPLTISEKELLKKSIKESQVIYERLLPSGQIKRRKN